MNTLGTQTLSIAVATALVSVAPQAFGQAEAESGVTAQLGLALQHDDNIFLSDQNLFSSIVGIVTPGLSLTAAPARQRFNLQYAGEIGWFDESPDDDYDDHFLEAGAYLKLGDIISFDVVGSYDQAHERRGTGLTEGFDPTVDTTAEPDEFERLQGLGRVGIGTTSSAGRLVLEGGYRNLEYTNNVDRTRFFDRDEAYGIATGYFNFRANTSLLLEARYTDVQYQTERPLEPTLDNEEFRYLVGITWESTAKTSGTVKFGYYDKQFVSPARGDFSDPTWEVDLRWSPRSYSHIDFRASKAPTATNGQGSFVDSNSYSVNWEHGWSESISSDLGARYVDADYRDSITSRNQKTTQFSLFLNYEMRRWLTWSAGVDVNARTSNIEQFEYEQNIYSIRALLTL